MTQDLDEARRALAAIVEKARRDKTKREQQEFKQRARQTNWHRDPDWHRDNQTQPFMFGEGLGNNLGLDPDKATQWTRVPTDNERIAANQEAEYEEFVLKPQRRKEAAAKAKATRARKKQRLLQIRQAIEEGRMLEGQRLFYLSWQHDNWDARAARFGGLPEGVDVAHTDFGDLLLVPVIEQARAKELRLDGGFKDREGRPFWIGSDLRQQVERIFGRVKWKQPLTVREVTQQFGARLT